MPAAVIQAYPERSIRPDSASYLFLVDRLLEGKGLHGDGTSHIDLQRTPGYPLFLAALFSVFGSDANAAVVLVQLLSGGIVAFILYYLGKLYFGSKVGIAAGLIYMLVPNVVLWSMAILSDVLFSLVLVLAFVPIALYVRNSKIWLLAVAGILLGMAGLIRPIGMMLLLLWAVLLVGMNAFTKKPLRHILLAGSVFVATAGMLLGAWVIRNTIVWDRTMLSSISVWNLGHYMAPAAMAEAEGISLNEARDLIPTTRIPHPWERDTYLGILLQYPVATIVTHLRGVGRVLTEMGRSNVVQILNLSDMYNGILSAVLALDYASVLERFKQLVEEPGTLFGFLIVGFSTLMQLFVYTGTLIGTVRSVRRGPTAKRWIAIFMILTAAVLIVLPGSVGNSRFRVPAEPYLAFLSAVGFVGWRRLVSEERVNLE